MAYVAVRKKHRLANPGRRKRMTAKQIRFFGTKRQRAALKKRKSNPRRKMNAPRPWKALYRARYPRKGKKVRSGLTGRMAIGNPSRRKSRRKKNVGSILVASIPGLNPGRKRRKRNVAHRRHRRHNAGRRHRRHYNARRRRSNPGRVIVRYRTRHHRRNGNRGRRRNPGFGDVGAVGGIILGATVNSMAMGFVPATFSSGIAGYIASAVIAVLQGQLVSKVFHKPEFGRQMTMGGFTYTALKVIHDFFPTLSLGLSGLGAVSPTNGFFVPQVPVFGSMGQFQPAGTLSSLIAAASAARGVKGLGNPNFSARRGGRIQ